MTRFPQWTALLMLLLFGGCPALAAPPHAEAAAPKAGRETRAFALRTGAFTVAYDGTKGPQANIAIRHGTREAHLTTALGGGLPLQCTAPQYLRSLRLSQNGDGARAVFIAERDWATLTGTLETYRQVPGLLRLRLDVKTKRPTRIEDATPELQFVGADEQPLASPGFTLYKQQAGLEAPVIYGCHDALDASLVYFQNLTSLNTYIGMVQGDPRYGVHLDGSAFGFHRPRGMVPGDVAFTLSDTFLWLSPDRQTDEFARAQQFIQAIGDIYDRLDKPATRYTDWPFQVVPQATRALLDPVNGLTQGGTRLLRSYVGNNQTTSEAITNLDVLIAAKGYAALFPPDANLTQLIGDLEKGLPLYYTPLRDGHTVSDNASPTTTTDSWYFVYPLVQTAELALMGSAQAKTMLLGSAATMTAVARDMHYEFPLTVDLVHGKELNGSVRENDTLGGYAYVMLTCYQLTNEARYLDEAKQAVEHIRGKEFRFTYETHLTAVTLESLGWLYQITGDRHYLDLSLIPLANLLSLTWLWQPTYGYAGGYSLFGGINPLPTSDQVAAMEQHNVWWYLRRFYLRAEAGLPPATRKLLAEMIKYQITVARSELPPFLPLESLCQTPYVGAMRPDMMIPIEDLHDGFHKTGLVGQEIYGAGLPFRFAADAYQAFGGDKGLLLYSEYPVTRSDWNAARRMLTFTLGGMPAYRSRVRLYNRETGSKAAWVVRHQNANGQQNLTPVERQAEYVEYRLAGGQTYQAVPASGTLPPLPASRTSGSLRFRLGAIVGAGGIVQVEADHELVLPLTVYNETGRAAQTTFRADLPPGWTLAPLTATLAAGETKAISLHLRAPHAVTGEPVQIAFAADVDGKRLPVLTTMAHVIAPLPDLDAGVHPNFSAWETRAGGQMTPQRGETVFASINEGAGLFETKAMTFDVDRVPMLTFDVASLTGQWAMKIHEEGDSGYGIYLTGDTARTGVIRFNLPQMLGWAGIHTFRLQLYVLGPKGTILRAQAWGLSN